MGWHGNPFVNHNQLLVLLYRRQCRLAGVQPPCDTTHSRSLYCSMYGMYHVHRKDHDVQQQHQQQHDITRKHTLPHQPPPPPSSFFCASNPPRLSWPSSSVQRRLACGSRLAAQIVRNRQQSVRARVSAGWSQLTNDMVLGA